MFFVLNVILTSKITTAYRDNHLDLEICMYIKIQMDLEIPMNYGLDMEF